MLLDQNEKMLAVDAGKEGTPILRVLTDQDARAELSVGLDEIVREGPLRMLVAAVEAEADGYVAAFTEEVDEAGHRLVRRNGHAGTRTATTAARGIDVTRPGVDDRRVGEETGPRHRIASVIIPPWCRKTAQAPDPPEDRQLHRVDLRRRETSDQAHQGTGILGSGPGHGL